jgi:DNA-binding NarL/FixJ family response regulator
MEPQPVQPSPALPMSALRAGEDRMRVFVVEDSPVIRENLSATLEEMLPARVVGTADSEAAAVAWLAAHPDGCDLVTVDVFLKGGSGLGVLKSLRDNRGRRQVVVLSNYATPDMRRRCLELGADRVFDKSSDVDALLAYCEDLAGRR